MSLNQIKIGVILSYLNILLSIIISIGLTPFMLKFLGQSQYGLYQLIISIVGYMILFEFGIGSTVFRYVAKFRHENRKNSEGSFLSIILRMYVFISICVAISGVVLYYNLDNLFAKTITPVELIQIKLMFVILVVNLEISIAGNVYVGIIKAYERYVYVGMVTLVCLVFRSLLIFLLLKKGYNAISIVILDTIINMLLFLVNIFYCKMYLKVKIKIISFDKILFVKIFNYSVFIFLSIVFEQALWRVLPVIVGAKISTEAVAIFSIAMIFPIFFMQFSNAISGVFLPVISKIVVAGESNEALTGFMIKVGRLQGIMLLYIYTAFAILGRQFIFLWVGDGYKEAWITALLVMTGLLIPLMENSGLSVLQIMNKHKYYVVSNIIITIFSLTATIIIIDSTGVIGVAMMIMLSYVVGNCIFLNWYYRYKIGIDIRRLFKELFKGIFPVAIVSGLFMYFIIGYIKINSWTIMTIWGIIFTLIYYISMWFFASNEYEKNLVLRPLNAIFVRKNLKN